MTTNDVSDERFSDVAQTDRCDNCRFWSRRSDERGSRGGGYCRRFPPFAPSAWIRFQEKWMPSDEYLNDAWPMTGAQSWCGEYASLQKQESGEAFECPINQPGCTKNCGSYGCGN